MHSHLLQSGACTNPFNTLEAQLKGFSEPFSCDVHRNSNCISPQEMGTDILRIPSDCYATLKCNWKAASRRKGGQMVCMHSKIICYSCLLCGNCAEHPWENSKVQCAVRQSVACRLALIIPFWPAAIYDRQEHTVWWKCFACPHSCCRYLSQGDLLRKLVDVDKVLAECALMGFGSRCLANRLQSLTTSTIHLEGLWDDILQPLFWLE